MEEITEGWYGYIQFGKKFNSLLFGRLRVKLQQGENSFPRKGLPKAFSMSRSEVLSITRSSLREEELPWWSLTYRQLAIPCQISQFFHFAYLNLAGVPVTRADGLVVVIQCKYLPARQQM